MCFSPSASFAAGTVLLAAGILSIKKASAPSYILFACIPLLFAVQQFAEGFVWLSLTNTNYLKWGPYATRLFLLFAQVVWPTLVPVSLLMMEKDHSRRKILVILTVTGILISIYLLGCLFVFPVQAEIRTGHIHYQLNFAIASAWFSGILYAIPAVLPFFISGVKKTLLLGIVILTSYLFTKLYYAENIVSVWCFFAAIASVIVLAILSGATEPAIAVKKEHSVHGTL